MPAAGVVCEYDLGDFLLFITFFPHLIAGPIIHHSEMMPQFAEPRTYHFRLEQSGRRPGPVLPGLFKKVVIADAHGGYASARCLARRLPARALSCRTRGRECWPTRSKSILISPVTRTWPSRWPGCSASSCRRISTPPTRRGIYHDFWRRWHMTLSRFLRDYLYIPLGGNRRGEFRRYVNLMVTMALGGLWHGAAWTFVLWGLFHGAGLAIQHGWQAFWSQVLPDRPALVASRAIHLVWSGFDSAVCHGGLGLVPLGGCADRAACAGGHVRCWAGPVVGSPILVKAKILVLARRSAGLRVVAAEHRGDHGPPYPAARAEGHLMVPHRRFARVGCDGR